MKRSPGWIMIKKNWTHGEDGDLFYLIDCAVEIEQYMKKNIRQGDIRNKFGMSLPKTELL